MLAVTGTVQKCPLNSLLGLNTYLPQTEPTGTEPTPTEETRAGRSD